MSVSFRLKGTPAVCRVHRRQPAIALSSFEFSSCVSPPHGGGGGKVPVVSHLKGNTQPRASYVDPSPSPLRPSPTAAVVLGRVCKRQRQSRALNLDFLRRRRQGTEGNGFCSSILLNAYQVAFQSHFCPAIYHAEGETRLHDPFPSPFLLPSFFLPAPAKVDALENQESGWTVFDCWPKSLGSFCVRACVCVSVCICVPECFPCFRCL